MMINSSACLPSTFSSIFSPFSPSPLISSPYLFFSSLLLFLLLLFLLLFISSRALWKKAVRSSSFLPYLQEAELLDRSRDLTQLKEEAETSGSYPTPRHSNRRASLDSASAYVLQIMLPFSLPQCEFRKGCDHVWQGRVGASLGFEFLMDSPIEERKGGNPHVRCSHPP